MKRAFSLSFCLLLLLASPSFALIYNFSGTIDTVNGDIYEVDPDFPSYLSFSGSFDYDPSYGFDAADLSLSFDEYYMTTPIMFWDEDNNGGLYNSFLNSNFPTQNHELYMYNLNIDPLNFNGFSSGSIQIALYGFSPDGDPLDIYLEGLIDNFHASPVPVPEPSIIALIGFGIAFLSAHKSFRDSISI